MGPILASHPTSKRGALSADGGPVLGAGCRRFKSSRPEQTKLRLIRRLSSIKGVVQVVDDMGNPLVRLGDSVLRPSVHDEGKRAFTLKNTW